MSFIVACEDARLETPGGALLNSFLSEVETALPDVFVLILCRRAPKDNPPHFMRDWVLLGQTFDDSSVLRFTSALAQMHRCRLLISLGSDFPAALSCDLDRRTIKSSEEIPCLIEELSRLVPLALTVSPEDSLTGLPARLATRPEAPSLLLDWAGGPVSSLLDLARSVVATDSRPIALQVGLPELLRGSARRVLLAVPAEIELRVVAEDAYSIGAATAAQTLLCTLRRERPRRRQLDGVEDSR